MDSWRQLRVGNGNSLGADETRYPLRHVDCWDLLVRQLNRTAIGRRAAMSLEFDPQLERRFHQSPGGRRNDLDLGSGCRRTAVVCIGIVGIGGLLLGHKLRGMRN